MKTTLTLLAVVVLPCASCSKRELPTQLTKEEQDCVAKYEEHIQFLDVFLKEAALKVKVTNELAQKAVNEKSPTQYDVAAIEEAEKAKKELERLGKEKWETELAKLKYVAEHKHTH